MYYSGYDVKHEYDIRNYDAEGNGFKLHSMQIKILKQKF